MTNAEKYLKEGADVEKFLEDIFSSAYPDSFEKALYIGKNAFRCWLKASIKPTLTEDERVILKNLIGCEWKIGREKSGELYLITVAHTKRYFGMYLHLFQFIKDGEEYSIEELLK